MSRWGSLFRRALHERRRLCFYGREPEPETAPDERIAVYRRWADVPAAYRRIVASAPLLSAPVWRMRRGRARLLCLSADGRTLAAYGWLQDWRSFRRRFGALAPDGTMLGPYWTAPAERGRGWYGRLLARSLALCPPDRPALIYAAPENAASRRGIAKAGFRPLGEWEWRCWLGVFSRFRRIPTGG